MKKFLVLFLILGMFTVLAPNTNASGVSDFYKQIEMLQRKANTLQLQLQGLALRAVSNDAVKEPTKEVPTAPVVETKEAPYVAPAPTPTYIPTPTKEIPSYVPPTTKTLTPTPNPTIVPAPTKITPPTVAPTTTKNTTPTTATNKTETISNTNTKLTVGSIGSNVLVLQKILIQKGYLKGIADGKFGKGTASAISKFQKENNLSIDGVAGKGTLQLLNTLISKNQGGTVGLNPCLKVKDKNGNTSTTPSISVISPNGGEVFTTGQQITVKWSSCNILSTDIVNVAVLAPNNIYPGGFSYGMVPQNAVFAGYGFTQNDGIEIFNLPNHVAYSGGSGYKISISVGSIISSNPLTFSSKAIDESNNSFTINNTSTTSITVTSPNGGETYTPGQQITVTWNSVGIPSINSNVSIMLQGEDSSGTPLSIIGLAITSLNDGTQTVTLPSLASLTSSGYVLGTHFKISVGTVDSSNNILGLDNSDNFFTIIDANTTPNYISQWGTMGVSNGQFMYPSGLAVNSSGDVYVTDQNNHRIQKFTSSGTYVTSWGTQGNGNGQFYQPMGVAVDSFGNVYVADTNNNRIQKFSSNGTYITQWGTLGSSNGQFYKPMGVALDSIGNVYVVEKNNHRIQKFSSTGTYITGWGTIGSGNGQFNLPSGITLDSSGNVYVADSNNHRIQKFTSAGVYVTQWGVSGSGNGQFYQIGGITIDLLGNIYVVDMSTSRIQKFTLAGTYLGQWGVPGIGNGQFNSPFGVVTDSSGNVYVSDYMNNRIQKFSY